MLIVAVAVGGAFYISGQHIAARESQQPFPSISVSGEGKVSAAPDIAALSFGVTTGRMTTAKAAMASLTKQMNAVFDAVKAAGIPEKDISSQQFSLSPAYDWTSGRQILVGYEASQMLAVKVRDLDKTAAVLSAATNAGANQAGDVNFTIDDPEKARAEARAKAIAQAKAQAQVIANQLGMHLGKITSYNEGFGGGYPVPMMMRQEMAGAMDSKAANIPLPTGEQDVMVNVSLTYELR
jgi:uncharacterized protein YggE